MKSFKFFLIFFSSAVLFAYSHNLTASRGEGAQEDVLSGSPNDVNQLLSSLERENVSLIPKTAVTPSIRQIEQSIEENAKETGFNFGFEYIPLLQHSDQGMEYDNASGGEFEFFARYRPFGHKQKKTAIGLKLEQKHRYGSIYPGEFQEQIASIFKTTSGYEALKPALTELWWQQMVVEGKMMFRLGKIDVTSVMNSYGFESRKFYFLSDVLTSYPIMDEPKRSLGAIAAVKFSPHLYLMGSVSDANGQEGTSGFNTIGRGEFYSALEFGYRGVPTNPASDNYHVFIWHTDARKAEGLASEHGYSVVLQKDITYTFIPFIKWSVNRGKTPVFKQLLLAGFVLHYPFGGKFGLLGVGVGHGKFTSFENEALREEQESDSELKSMGSQVVMELFYRIQLTPYSQLTPDVQLIKTLPHRSHIGQRGSRWAPVGSLRWRAAL